MAHPWEELVAAAQAAPDRDHALALCAQAADAGADGAAFWKLFGGHALNAGSPWALELLRRAAAQAPEDPEILAGLAAAAATQGDQDAARGYCRQAIARHRAQAAPGIGPALHNLGVMALNLGDYSLAVETLPAALACGGVDESLLKAQMLIAAFMDAAQPPAVAESWARSWARSLKAAGPRTPTRPQPGLATRPLHLGLLIARPGCGHLAATLQGVLHGLSQQEARVTVYADGDSVIQRRYDFEFVDISQMSDDEVNLTIFHDSIDVFFTHDNIAVTNRRELFFKSSAPMRHQAGHSFFPFDGLLFDAFIMDYGFYPPDMDQDYQETLLRLPSGAIYDRAMAQGRPPVAPPPCADGRSPCFGSFNRASKIDAAAAAFWGLALRATPDARLFLSNGGYAEEETRRKVLALLAAEGVAAERVQFRGGVAQEEFLRGYDAVDVALDTVTFSGGLTTLDALLQGVPTIALPSAHIWGRTSASILTAAGLADLCLATTPAEGAAKAAALIADPARLATLRAGLRAQTLASPLFDTELYAASLLAQCRAWLLARYPDAA